MAHVKKKEVTKTPTQLPSTVHLPYFQMINEAITLLKDRSGSSQPAIAKFLEVNYPTQLPQNFKKILSVELNNLVKSEKLVKVKNSYKISTSPTAKMASDPPTKKNPEKVSKTKMLSQVKTPEVLKTAVNMEKNDAKMKRSSPEQGTKKRKKKDSAGTKGKSASKSPLKSLRPASKMAKN